MSDKVATEKTPSEQASAGGASDNTASSETPMFAVWLALLVTVAAGLYGLKLGIESRSKPSSVVPAKTSMLTERAALGRVIAHGALS